MHARVRSGLHGVDSHAWPHRPMFKTSYSDIYRYVSATQLPTYVGFVELPLWPCLRGRCPPPPPHDTVAWRRINTFPPVKLRKKKCAAEFWIPSEFKHRTVQHDIDPARRLPNDNDMRAHIIRRWLCASNEHQSKPLVRNEVGTWNVATLFDGCRCLHAWAWALTKLWIYSPSTNNFLPKIKHEREHLAIHPSVYLSTLPPLPLLPRTELKRQAQKMMPSTSKCVQIRVVQPLGPPGQKRGHEMTKGHNSNMYYIPSSLSLLGNSHCFLLLVDLSHLRRQHHHLHVQKSTHGWLFHSNFSYWSLDRASFFFIKNPFEMPITVFLNRD
jgi:hypothetical protein